MKTSCQIPTLKTDQVDATSNMGKASLLNEVPSHNLNTNVPLLTEVDCQNFKADLSTLPSEYILCTEEFIFSLL